MCTCIKQIENFNKCLVSLDGFQNKCKFCNIINKNQYIKQNKLKDIPSNYYKVCLKCDQKLHHSEFNHSYTHADTLKNVCKLCVLVRNKKLVEGYRRNNLNKVFTDNDYFKCS